MSDLAARMRSAANTLEEVSALYGYRYPCEQGWSAAELRREAAHVDTTTPAGAADFGDCSGHVYSGEEPA